MTLEEEERRMTELLAGKTVSVVRRHRSKEIVIQFTDWTRLLVDTPDENMELSVTNGFDHGDGPPMVDR